MSRLFNKAIIIGDHARFEMQRRGISRPQVLAVLRQPGQVVPSRKGRSIYQSKTGRGRLLLRVVVKEVSAAYHVITVYKTSKIAKYWRRP